MNLKTALMVLAMGGLAVAGVGCGNDCEAAADTILAKYESCGGEIATDDDGSDGGGECTEEAGVLALCTADCIDAADCTLVVPDPENPPDADAAQAYLDCITACSE